jgi:LPXTG-site transpeptidase (sortase) family protein
VTITNPYHSLDGFSLDLFGIEFTHLLPPGLQLAEGSPETNTCGGSYSGSTGDENFSLSGFSLPSSSVSETSSCDLIILLNAKSTGDYTLEQPAGSVTSVPINVSGGANVRAASASLMVLEAIIDPGVGVESKAIPLPEILPDTGFSPGKITKLPFLPSESIYTSTGGLVLEIPKLGVMVQVVGVPVTETGWDVSWLQDQAGWLHGTTFPTWTGNASITGHVWNANNQPGAFYQLDQLRWGDQVIIHLAGSQYVFEVRSIRSVKPDDTRLILRDEGYSWLNLITCKDFDEASDQYRHRLIVRTVLVEVK